MNPGDIVTSDDEWKVDAMGRNPVRLQLSKIFMHMNADNQIVKWDGKDPAGRCSVFILSNLEDSFLHSNIDIGDLRSKQNTLNPSFNAARITTASLIRRNIGCPFIGTYLYPPLWSPGVGLSEGLGVCLGVGVYGVLPIRYLCCKLPRKLAFVDDETHNTYYHKSETGESNRKLPR